MYPNNLNATTMTESENICVICLEGEKCYKMSLILNYTKQCECDCIVHSHCLRNWQARVDNKCLICQKIAFIRNSNFNKIGSPELNHFQENLINSIQIVLISLIFVYIHMVLYPCPHLQQNPIS